MYARICKDDYGIGDRGSRESKGLQRRNPVQFITPMCVFGLYTSDRKEDDISKITFKN